jgi:hypothetical protein
MPLYKGYPCIALSLSRIFRIFRNNKNQRTIISESLSMIENRSRSYPMSDLQNIARKNSPIGC